MSKNTQVRQLCLRGGIEFTAIFEKRSGSSIVVKAENRNPMRVMKHDLNGKWSARVDGTGSIYYNDDPAKAFAICAAAKWRKCEAKMKENSQ